MNDVTALLIILFSLLLLLLLLVVLSMSDAPSTGNANIRARRGTTIAVFVSNCRVQTSRKAVSEYRVFPLQELAFDFFNEIKKNNYSKKMKLAKCCCSDESSALWSMEPRIFAV